MNSLERDNLVINIENLANIISSRLGPKVVASVFEHYGVHDVWDLNPNYLTDVFSELHFIESDM